MLVIRMRFLNPQPTLTFLRGEALALIYLIVLIFRLFFLGIFHDHKAQFTLFLFSSIGYVLEQSLSNEEGIEMITSTELHLHPYLTPVPMFST